MTPSEMWILPTIFKQQSFAFTDTDDDSWDAAHKQASKQNRLLNVIVKEYAF